MLIVGTGAVASWLSHRLTEVGVPLQHFGRRSKRLDRLSLHTLGYPVRACSEARDVVAHDLWIVVTKAGQNFQKIEQLLRAPRPKAILVLQNGVQPETAWLQLDRAVERGLLTYGVASVGPGQYRGGDQGEIVLRQDSQFSGVLKSAGLQVRESASFTVELWLKLAVNASLNVVCSIESLSNGEAWSRRSTRTLIEAAALEVVALAQGLGVEVSEEQALKTLSRVAQQTSANVCSTLSDLRNQRLSEYAHINGALLKRARTLGLSAPVLSRLDERFANVERAALAPRSWLPIPKLRALRLAIEPAPVPVFQGLDLRLAETPA